MLQHGHDFYMKPQHPSGDFTAQIVSAWAYSSMRKESVIQVRLKTEYGPVFLYLWQGNRHKWERIFANLVSKDWDCKETDARIIAKRIEEIKTEIQVTVRVHFGLGKNSESYSSAVLKESLS